MYGTRLHSPMAPAIEGNGCSAIIVAHGFPSDPEPQDESLKALAAAVAALCDGWTVRGATLAMPGSLARALKNLYHPLIYPFFMAEGYFTGEVLPRRLKEVSAKCRQLPAFGSDPAIPELVAEAVMTGARSSNRVPAETTLLLAAHGSRISSASRLSTLGLAQNLVASLPFKSVVVGFIEEPPFLADAARDLGSAICLPLFTLNAGHVINDLPHALAKAGFEGPVLAPIGTHRDVPRLISAALVHHASKAAA